MMKLLRLLIPMAVPVLLAGGAFAYMGSIDVPVTHAGTGQGAINGYHISNITYTIDGPNNKLTSIAFDLDGIATDLSVQFTNGSGNWYGISHGGCTGTPVGPGTHVVCTVSEPLSAINGLMVSAEQFT